MLLNTVLFVFLATAVYTANAMHYPSKTELLWICEINNVTSDKLEQAKVAIDAFVECSPVMPHFDQLPADLEAAKASGSVNEVAGRFCEKAEPTKSCSTKYYQATGICGLQDMQRDIPYMTNTMNRIIDYMCNKEGDKWILAKFVDEGAMQCLSSGGGIFPQCARNVPSSIKSAKGNLYNLFSCVVDKLKECSPAVGVRAQDMFDHILN